MRVLKEKYFPRLDFLNAHLGNNPSYVWKSKWDVRGILKEGCVWKVGNGDRININEDAWVLRGSNHKFFNTVQCLQNFKVLELIY